MGRKELEKRLYLQSAALEAAANAIVITNTNGNIEWVNPAFTRMTGYSREEITGQHTRILKSGEHDESFYKSLWDTVLSGRVWRGELVNRRKDGSFYNEEQTITPVKDTNGKITHFIAIKQDVTEKRKLEQQLLHAQRMESMGALASGIAHDLNNILQPIMMSLNMLKEQTGNDIADKWIKILEDSANRGVSVVSQILSFARGSEAEFEYLNIKSLAEEAASMLSSTFPQNIKIDTNISEELWDISGNLTQIYQVLMNMFINARDAMPNGGTLSISLENLNIDDNYSQIDVRANPGPYVLIDITDTGEGIKSEYIEKIFDPFFTTKEEGKGTGLGLSISYSIIKEHGGFIHIDTELGKGTKFKIYLPAIKQDEPVNRENVLTKEIPQGHGELILVVDDEDVIREITKLTLENNGYRALTANNGAEAIAVYIENKNNIDLVVMDSMMPTMSGAACIKALRRITPELKIISSSGAGKGSKSTADVDESEINAELTKPYTSEQLLNTIHNTLQNYRTGNS